MRALEEEHDHLAEKTSEALKGMAEGITNIQQRYDGVVKSAENVIKTADDVITAGKEQTEQVRGLRKSYEAQFKLFQKLRENLEKGGEDGNC